MPRYLLDTNLLGLALAPNSSLALWHRANPTEISLSIITVREALRGALASITEAESPQSTSKLSLSRRYVFLAHLLEGLQEFPKIPYSDEAEALYQSFPKSVQRIGPNDCRIAASAIVEDRIVLTKNTADFARIAEHDSRLRFEDWTDISSPQK
jgi:tRNA(fMet)-specific endonuclease VapC